MPRRLAELRGAATLKLVWVDDRRVGFTNAATEGGTVYRFACRCGATPQRQHATLDAEFASAPPKGRIYLS